MGKIVWDSIPAIYTSVLLSQEVLAYAKRIYA